MVENLGIGGGDSAAQEHQNKFPNAGSMYKGRALVSFRLEPEQRKAENMMAKAGRIGKIFQSPLMRGNESGSHVVNLHKTQKVSEISDGPSNESRVSKC
jgi:hypothetical protein